MADNDRAYFSAQATSSYFAVNADRARGLLPEKESTKAAAAIVVHNLPSASTFLDAGCSAGHLLKSLVSAGLPVKAYTGIDLDEPAIRSARDIYANEAFCAVNFEVASVTDMPVDTGAVEVAISLNVLEHMKSPIATMAELMRIASKLIVIRTSVRDSTYIIQEVRNSDMWTGVNSTYSELPPPSHELTEQGEALQFVYQNMWGRGYLEAQIARLNPGAQVVIVEDTLFSADAIRADNQLTGLPNAALATGHDQVVGPLILPHCWVLIGVNGLVPSMP